MKGLKSEIFSNGKLVSSDIVSLDIIKLVNRIPYAQVVICEGGEKDKSVVEMSNEGCFKPGKEIELSLSQGNKKDVFKGIVVKHKIKKTSENTFLTIDIKDKCFKLSLKRNSAVFKDKDDKQIIKDIAGKKSIDIECNATTYKHKQIVQYYCTDWDFIVSRAEANGLIVAAENGKLIIKKPNLSNAATELSEIFEFEMEADMGSQYKEIESICWDIKNAKCATYKNTNNISLENQHNYNDLSNFFGTDKCVVVNGVYAEREEMELWANAKMMKNRFSMLRGRVSIEGNPTIKMGDSIKIAGAGDMFNCKTIVAGIRHRITKSGWTTDIQCGLSSQWFYNNDDIIERPAAGLVPGINGLQTGVVEAFPSDGDPDKLYRIKIRIPAVDEKESVVWARLLFPYAGKDRGIFFVPEKGDEVVVGFFNDDPRHAVVLGALYNGKAGPPLKFTDKNNEKGIITRSGIKLVFTDEQDKEKIEVKTPAGNHVLLEDENGIKIKDKNDNKVTFHDKGITVEDKNSNKIKIDDKGINAQDTNKNGLILNNEGIECKCANGNTISLSSAGIELKDMNGNKLVLEASGISMESSAQMVLKGAMIKLN